MAENVRIVRNPQTGERMKAVNGQWVPIESVSVSEAPLQNVPGNPNSSPASFAFSDAMLRTFFNNIMATPSASGDLLAGTAALAQTTGESLLGGNEQGFVSRLGQNFESQQGLFPASALRAIPRPQVHDVTSALKSIPSLIPGGESPPDAFTRHQAASEMGLQRQAIDHPIATGLGNTGGDVMSVAAGRAPFAKNLSRNATRGMKDLPPATLDALDTIAKKTPEIMPDIVELINRGTLSQPGAMRMWRQITNSGPFASVMRGLGKSAEASLEGALLAAVKENDPLTNAAIAGGSQMAASTLSSVFSIPTSMKDLAIKSAAWVSIYSIADQFTEYASTEDAALGAFDKMKGMFTIGVLSHLLGGRFRGSNSTIGRSFSENMPKLSDAINTIPRASMMSFINTVQSERETYGNSNTLQTLERLATNPAAFPEGIRNRLSRAINNGTLGAEITRLMTNEDFTNALEGN